MPTGGEGKSNILVGCTLLDIIKSIANHDLMRSCIVFTELGDAYIIRIPKEKRFIETVAQQDCDSILVAVG